MTSTTYYSPSSSLSRHSSKYNFSSGPTATSKFYLSSSSSPSSCSSSSSSSSSSSYLRTRSSYDLNSSYRPSSYSHSSPSFSSKSYSNSSSSYLSSKYAPGIEVPSPQARATKGSSSAFAVGRPTPYITALLPFSLAPVGVGSVRHTKTSPWRL